MSPPSVSDQAHRGQDTKRKVALKFDKIGRMARFYLAKDMDEIAEKMITADLRYLENIHTEFAKTQKSLPPEGKVLFIGLANKIESQVHQIIPHLYRARGAKQKGEQTYYDWIQASRTNWQNILNLLRRELM